MRFIELQIAAFLLALTGQLFIIFKKKVGWLFQASGLTFIIIINYHAELYLLIIATAISVVVVISGWFKWRRDEIKNTIKEVKE